MLIIGYRNPSNLENRILECKDRGLGPIYVFIDCVVENSSNGKLIAANKRCLEVVEKYTEIGLIHESMTPNRNLGQGIGIPAAIDWIFNFEEYALILEDDCKFITSDMKYLNFVEQHISSKIEPNSIYCLTTIWGRNALSQNCHSDFVSLNFFSSWGWITSAKTWKETFSRDLKPYKLKDSLFLKINLSIFHKFLFVVKFNSLYKSITRGGNKTWAFFFTRNILDRGIRVYYPTKSVVFHEASIDSVHVLQSPKWYEANLEGRPLKKMDEKKLLRRLSTRFVADVYGVSLRRSLTYLAIKVLRLILPK